MGRVTGIGGIFFKAKDPAALRAWYQQHLGISVQAWGGAIFEWADPQGLTTWNISSEQSDSMAPSQASFMINYRVEDLHGLVSALRSEGCTLVGDLEESEYGKFAWVLDPEGNKVELWEPPVGQ